MISHLLYAEEATDNCGIRSRATEICPEFCCSRRPPQDRAIVWAASRAIFFAAAARKSRARQSIANTGTVKRR